jgi:hypothetical protein
VGALETRTPGRWRLARTALLALAVVSAVSAIAPAALSPVLNVSEERATEAPAPVETALAKTAPRDGWTAPEAGPMCSAEGAPEPSDSSDPDDIAARIAFEQEMASPVELASSAQAPRAEGDAERTLEAEPLDSAPRLPSERALEAGRERARPSESLTLRPLGPARTAAYTRAPPTAADDPQVQFPSGLHRAVLVTVPAGADVLIDGSYLGRSPITVQWPPGVVSQVSVRLKGYEPAGFELSDRQAAKMLELELVASEGRRPRAN